LDGFLFHGGAGGGKDDACRVLPFLVEGRGEGTGNRAEGEETGDLLSGIMEADPEGPSVEVVG